MNHSNKNKSRWELRCISCPTKHRKHATNAPDTDKEETLNISRTEKTAPLGKTETHFLAPHVQRELFKKR